MSVKDHVDADKKCFFICYANEEFWYRCEKSGFEFPIPLADTAGATFAAEEKSLYCMRWIRKHMEKLAKDGVILEMAKEEAAARGAIEE